MAITQQTITKSYGATEIQINVPFTAPPLPSNAVKTSKPITAQIQVAVATTGGSIAGGQSLYYHLSAIDSLSQESIPSDPIEVIIPSGANTNKVTLSGPSPFDANAVLYNVYRSIGSPNGQGGTTSGTGPSQLFSNQTPPTSCAPISIVDTGSNGGGGGTGDPSKMPVAQNLLKTRAYWQLNGESQWRFGGETLNGAGTAVNFVVPHNIQGQQINVQLRAVDNQLNETHSSIAPTYSYTIAAAYPAGIGVGGAPGANDGLIIGGLHVIDTSGHIDKSTPLNKQASIVSVGFPPAGFTYAATTTTITWTWGAFTIYNPDGTSISVPANGTGISFSGLTASTSYFFGCYWNVAGAAINIVLSDVSSGTAKESLAQLIQTVGADGNVSVFINVSASTTASGTGGGGGGGGGTGGCFSGNVRIRTTEGFRRFDELPTVGRFQIVNETGIHWAELVVHESHAERMIDMGNGEIVTGNHIMKSTKDFVHWVAARDKFRDAPRVDFDGTVYNLHVQSENPADHHYILENGEVAHNFKYV